MAKRKASKKKASKKSPARTARAASRASEAKTRHKKPRQQPLPGTESAFNAKIEKAAHAYVDIRDARMELTAQEVPAKAKLIDAMHETGEKVYRRGNLEVVLTVEKEKIKVRLKDDTDTSGADDDEPEPDDVDVETGEDTDVEPQ